MSNEEGFDVRFRVTPEVLKKLLDAGVRPVLEVPEQCAIEKREKPSLEGKPTVPKARSRDPVAIEGGGSEQVKDCDTKNCSVESPAVTPAVPKEMGRRSRRRS